MTFPANEKSVYTIHKAGVFLAVVILLNNKCHDAVNFELHSNLEIFFFFLRKRCKVFLLTHDTHICTCVLCAWGQTIMP